MFHVISKFNISPTTTKSDVKININSASVPWSECLKEGRETLASLPWIKLVDDALEADDREKSGAESGQAGQEENAKRQQGLPARRL